MKFSFMLLLSGIAITGAAVQLGMDIFVLLMGICVSAAALTSGFLVLVKKQYDRSILSENRGSTGGRKKARSAA